MAPTRRRLRPANIQHRPDFFWLVTDQSSSLMEKVWSIAVTTLRLSATSVTEVWVTAFWARRLVAVALKSPWYFLSSSEVIAPSWLCAAVEVSGRVAMVVIGVDPFVRAYFLSAGCALIFHLYAIPAARGCRCRIRAATVGEWRGMKRILKRSVKNWRV